MRVWQAMVCGFVTVSALVWTPLLAGWPICDGDQCSALGWANSLGTMIAASSAVAAALISWRAVIYVRDTLTETRNSVRAANDAVKEARRIGEAQVRAYLTFTGGEYRIDANGAWYMITVKNAGQTPALNIQARCYVFKQKRHMGRFTFDTRLPPISSKVTRAIMVGESVVITCSAISSDRVTASAEKKAKMINLFDPDDVADLANPHMISHYANFSLGWNDVFGKRQNIQGALAEERGSVKVGPSWKRGKLIASTIEHYADAVQKNDQASIEPTE